MGTVEKMVKPRFRSVEARGLSIVNAPSVTSTTSYNAIATVPIVFITPTILPVFVVLFHSISSVFYSLSLSDSYVCVASNTSVTIAIISTMPISVMYSVLSIMLLFRTISLLFSLALAVIYCVAV